MIRGDRVVDADGRGGVFYRYEKYRDGKFAMVKWDDMMSLRRVAPGELTRVAV